MLSRAGPSTAARSAQIVRFHAQRLCQLPNGARIGLRRSVLEACWHRAAVATVRASRQGFGLPVDGPSAEDERAAKVLAAGENLARLERMFAA